MEINAETSQTAFIFAAVLCTQDGGLRISGQMLNNKPEVVGKWDATLGAQPKPSCVPVSTHAPKPDTTLPSIAWWFDAAVESPLCRPVHNVGIICEAAMS